MRIGIFLSIVMVVLAAGCSDEGGGLTVTFDSRGGSTVAAVSISSGDSLGILPDLPKKTGYTFGGWWTAPYGAGTEFTAATVVTADITVYAFWTSDALAALNAREMVYVSGSSGGMYTQMSNTNAGFVHNIRAFRIGKYEVTYALWYTVYQWATNSSNGYTFSSAGMEGSVTGGGMYPAYANIGAAPVADGPVTMVTWRDAIVWCNAYSQMSGLSPVYYTDSSMNQPLKTATSYGIIETTEGSQDNPFVAWSADGYRLPTEGEWQYAAAYRDSSSWTPFNYASGAVTNAWNTNDVNPVDGYPDGKNANDTVAVYGHYCTNVSSFVWPTNGITATDIIGARDPNALGLYDMSGNVYEWCWDWGGALSGRAGG